MPAAPAPTAISRRTARSATSPRRNTPAPSCSRRPGKRTPVFVRFSTVDPRRTSPETLRDPRGFAVKFYTEDGNWDLVGNNLQIFFIRDAMKFPDMVHAFKPDPVTNRQEPGRIFDFVPAPLRNRCTWSPGCSEPVGHSRQLPPHGRLGRQHLQVGQRRRASAHAGQVPLGAQAGREEPDQPSRPRRSRRTISTTPPRICTTRSSAATSRSGSSASRSWRRRAPGARLRPAGRHEALAARTSSRCCRSGGWCWTATPRITSPRSSRPPSAPACWWTASTSRTTRCCRGGRSPTRIPSATASARTTCSCRSTRRRAAHRTNQRDGQMAYHVDARGENPHVNYEPSSMGGLHEAPKPRQDHHQYVEGHLGRYQTAGVRTTISRPASGIAPSRSGSART